MAMVTAHRSTRKAAIVCLAGALLLASACRNEARREPQRVYARAIALRQKGNVAAALKESSAAFDSWNRQPESLWYWRFRVLKAELLLIQADVRNASPLVAQEPPAGLPDRQRIVARLLSARARVADIQDHLPEAIELWGRACAIAEANSLSDLLPVILQARGSRYGRAGDFEKGEADLRKAIALAEQNHDRYVLVSALANMGYYLVRRFRYDEALSWSQQALEISQHDGFEALTAGIQVNTSWAYYRLGNLEKAGETFLAAEKALGRMGLKQSWLVALGNIGNFHLSQGEYRQAIPYFEQAYRVAEELRNDSERATWLNNLAMAHLQAGDLDAADRYNRRAQELYPANSPSRVFPILNGAKIAMSRRNYEEAGRLYQSALAARTPDPFLQWETRAGMAELHFARKDLTGARSETEQALLIVDGSWARLSNDQSKLTFQSRLANFSRAYVDFLMSQNRSEEALEFAESRRGRLLAEKMHLPMDKGTAGGGLRALAGQLHAVLLSYWLAPAQSYLWVVTASEIRTFPLPPESQIRALAERYSRTIQDHREVDLTSNASARELYQILLAPAQALIPPGSRIVLAPDGALHSLNFETLVTTGGHYWLEDAVIEVVASLRLMNRGVVSPAKGQAALLIGDAEENVSGLPKLLAAATEIAEIAALFAEHQVIVGKAASPEAYGAAGPERFATIHFAAHAVANPESPLESAVILSPGVGSHKLYARDVQKIPISARLVTVSACRSAGARPFLGEGMVGFAWAFLSAGAQNVIATLWEVPDQSTARFMRLFYERIRKNMRPAEALREVKLEFLRSEESTRKKPYYWAAFQAYTR
jgi:CHAT domain-containing protein/Tfp pilus assembly protein PilF